MNGPNQERPPPVGGSKGDGAGADIVWVATGVPPTGVPPGTATVDIGVEVGVPIATVVGIVAVDVEVVV
jgi:hypothetical protein